MSLVGYTDGDRIFDGTRRFVIVVVAVFAGRSGDKVNLLRVFLHGEPDTKIGVVTPRANNMFAAIVAAQPANLSVQLMGPLGVHLPGSVEKIGLVAGEIAVAG